MRHIHQSLFLERKIIRFAGGETPSEPVGPAHPLEVGGKFQYGSWKEFMEWVGHGGKDGVISMLDDMLKDGDLGVILPDGSSVFPRAYWDGNNEVALKDGMKLSYTQGVIDKDGKPVELRIVSSKTYPSREVLDRHVMKTASAPRLRAEMTSLRSVIEFRASLTSQAKNWAEFIAEKALLENEDSQLFGVKALIVRGRYEEAAKIVEETADILWKGRLADRRREEGMLPVRKEGEKLPMDEQYGNPFNIHYDVTKLRNKDGTVNVTELEYLSTRMEDDFQKIGLAAGLNQKEGLVALDRYDMLRKALEKNHGIKPDEEEAKWHEGYSSILRPSS